MNPLLVAAMLLITLAFVAYTLGVFAERRAGTLAKRHLALFWFGLVFDTSGTTVMSMMAGSAGGMASPMHALTGGLAILLMLFHAVWASFVVARGSDKARAGFHRLSICVWLFWLVPYAIGMLMGIPGVHLSDAAAATVSFAAVLALGVFFCVKANLARRRG